MEWMIMPLRKYARFTGRSRRKEYWMFLLFVIVVAIVLSILDAALGLGGGLDHQADLGEGAASASFNANGGVLTLIFYVAILIPSIAVAVRRLHDIDKSGWWILIGLVPLIGAIVLLVFYCTDGTRGPNRFGADPKADATADLAEKFN